MSTAAQGLAVLAATLTVAGFAWLGWTRSVPPSLEAAPDEEPRPQPQLPPPVLEPAKKKGDRPSAPKDGLRGAFMELDRDGDGRVSISEYSEDGQWAARFLERDTDGDGFVTRDELKSTRGQVGELLERWRDFPIPAADADGDGALDRSEFPGPPEIFIHLDTNDDGRVDESEVAAPQEG
ncbi:MAG TPA: hypothetical protein QGF58_13135 [Myxococcota bacterium]|nr:hypothetical protein [Myxococcota bacterium]